MKNFSVFYSIISVLIILNCTANKQLKSPVDPVIENANSDKAYSHYLSGSLLDFQDQYEKALIEYYQAQLYDSNSAQIHKAIARNLIRLQYYEGAMENLKKSHKLNPKDRETLNYLAESYYHLQKNQEAIQTYKKLLLLDPYDKNVQNNLIFLYTHLKMDTALADFYKQMMSFYPQNSNYSIQYALVRIRQRKLEEARMVLEDLVKNDSSQTKALLLLGNLYEVNKDTAQAISTYQNILSHDPTNEEILNRLYRIYRTQQEWNQIEKIYEPIIAQYTNHSQARLILGETYYYQEKRTEARDVIKPVLNDEDYKPAAFELLGRIAFEEEKYDDAEKYFSQLTEVHPKNRFGWLLLAVLYNRQNDFQNSIKVLQEALTIHSEDSDLLGMYGSTLSEVGRNEEAIRPLEKALQLNQNNLVTITSIAAVYDKLKIYVKSDSLYQRAIKKNPDNALLLNNYSYSLAQRGIQLNMALDMVNRALDKDPDNGAYLDTKGWIYYKMGKYEMALEFIEKALHSREESAELLDHLGDVYYKMNQLDKAKIHWQKALEKDPDNTELKGKIQNL